MCLEELPEHQHIYKYNRSNLSGVMCTASLRLHQRGCEADARYHYQKWMAVRQEVKRLPRRDGQRGTEKRSSSASNIQEILMVFGRNINKLANSRVATYIEQSRSLVFIRRLQGPRVRNAILLGDGLIDPGTHAMKDRQPFEDETAATESYELLIDWATLLSTKCLTHGEADDAGIGTSSLPPGLFK
ncbi:hypothetical protein OE88DRAFT_1644460 [Heliocybe sulcata]|uniref:Uncharacterized protein n=1 Tax=Heliocybe sulcata TaxID=5364 RepID=A0A5C3N4A8_9AGAM|nr:hypothetical protein OE88DRAFT_1644460 [Heliocybe sulcata]